MKQKLRFLMLTLLCAVFSTAWGQTATTYKLTIDASVFNSTSYAANNNEKTSYAVCTTDPDKTYEVKWTSNQIMSQSGEMQWQKSNGYLYNSTDLGTITDVTVTSSTGSFTTYYGTTEKPSTNTTVGGGFFQTKVGGATGKTSKVEITFQITEQQPTGDKYYVAGSWTDPIWEDGKIQMTKSSDGKYILSDQLLPKNALFKIIKVPSSGTNSVWCGGNADGDNYWVTVDNHTNIPLNVGGGKDFYMPIAGRWTFIVDPTGDTPKLTVEGSWPVWEYYLVGDFNEWATTSIDSYKFNQVETTGDYTLNKPIKYQEKFKIYAIRGNEEKWFGAVSDGDFWVNSDLVDTELSLTTENGGNNFYMNLSNKKDYWTLDFNPENTKLVLSNFLSDIAELPFKYDGGRNAIENTAGLTQTGLGTDYDTEPKLKFDHASDAVILHFNERPGTLSYDIKGNSFSGGTFQVLASEDGVDWDVLKEYNTIDGSVTNEVFDNLDENVRYIKWLYKQKVNGNVALGNIKLEKYVAPQPYTVTISQIDNAEIFVFYNDGDYTPIENGGQVLSGSEVLISVSANEGYQIVSVTVTDGDEQNITLTDVPEEEGTAWTFIMPKSNVTVTCTVNKIPDEEWVLTSLEDLTEDDIFVIVGNTERSYAMTNNNGTSNPPTAEQVVVIGNKIVSEVGDNIKWTISSNANDGYTFYPNGDKEKWLYTTDSNNGVRVGTNTNKVFTLENNYLKNKATSRYVGIFNQEWRCYDNTNGNIAGQTFGFYKLVKKFTFTINEAAYDGESYYATIADLGAGYYKVGNDFEVSTVAVVNGKLEIAPFESGTIIPGKAAYLVRSATAGIHKLSPVYPLPSGFTPIDVNGNNMLYSTGNGKKSPSLTAAEMEAKPLNEGNYMFYKLSLNKNHEKIGFYWGADGGAAFDYGKGHQAFLAVPQTNGEQGAAAYFFDGDATGIYSITATEGESESNNATYTLSGIRVDNKQLPKGIYIKNGKKVVVR